MNKKGMFGPVIMFVLAFMLIWVWVIITPSAVEPAIEEGISGSATAEHSGGVEFFLRMIPWAVPIIIFLGIMWMAVFK